MTSTEQKTDGKLLPCPFCAHPFISQEPANDDYGTPAVICLGCDATVTGKTAKAAITAWNTRALPPMSREVDELLRDMRDEVQWTDVATMPIPLYERMKEIFKYLRPTNTEQFSITITDLGDEFSPIDFINPDIHGVEP